MQSGHAFQPSPAIPHSLIWIKNRSVVTGDHALGTIGMSLPQGDRIMNAPQDLVRQHLIDPELCIRCGCCAEACTEKAISSDGRSYAIDFDRCAGHLDCTNVCSTGAINTWREVPFGRAYALVEQFAWESVPAQAPPVQADVPAMLSTFTLERVDSVVATESASVASITTPRLAELPPWSAAHPYLNLYTVHRPAQATVVRNHRVTAGHASGDIHHLVLDFGTQPFPVLEGQSIGIVPPGRDAAGRAHPMRAYSVASPRDGEDPDCNRVALTVKRVTQDQAGQPVYGVCSNHLCDLDEGATVQVVGPFGATFLMPDHAAAKLLMICTGTGIAPMRGMIERRLRVGQGKVADEHLMLFYGGRAPEEMPYYDALLALQGPVDLHIALSRVPSQPRQYVQDLIRERDQHVARWLRDDETYLYVCGLKGMEHGVLQALRDICAVQGLDWPVLHERMMTQGRMHIETY